MPYLILVAVLVAASPFVAAQGAPGQELQSEVCQTTCRVFGTAPPPCQCPPTTIQSGHSTAPQAVRARMREAYARRVETVDNYTALVTTSMTPIPVVQYFEKEIVGGEPVFRQVSPAEIAEREAEAGGGPTPAQMGAGFASVLDAVRGRTAEPDVPDLPPAAQGPLEGLLGQVADGLQGMFDALLNPTQFDTEQDLVQMITQLDAFWERAELLPQKHNITVPHPRRGETGYPENITFRLPVYQAKTLHEIDIDLGPGSEDYRIRTAAVYLGESYEEPFPVAVRALIEKISTGDTMFLHQINSWYRRAGPMVEPRLTHHSMHAVADDTQLSPEEVLMRFVSNSGLPGLFEGLASMEKTILRLYINTGPPTSEESAILIREALEVAEQDRIERSRRE